MALFHPQRGNRCLLHAFAMAIQTPQLDFWEDLLTIGANQHVQEVLARWPNYDDTDWFFAQVGSADRGWYPSDLLRALNLSGLRFDWRKVRIPFVLLANIRPNRQLWGRSFVVVGIPTESDVAAYLRSFSGTGLTFGCAKTSTIDAATSTPSPSGTVQRVWASCMTLQCGAQSV